MFITQLSQSISECVNRLRIDLTSTRGILFDDVIKSLGEHMLLLLDIREFSADHPRIQQSFEVVCDSDPVNNEFRIKRRPPSPDLINVGQHHQTSHVLYQCKVTKIPRV